MAGSVSPGKNCVPELFKLLDGPVFSSDSKNLTCNGHPDTSTPMQAAGSTILPVASPAFCAGFRVIQPRVTGDEFATHQLADEAWVLRDALRGGLWTEGTRP